METLFQQIAKEEGVELQVAQGVGTRLITFHPFKDYQEGVRIIALQLNIPYRKQVIDLEHRLGDHQLGSLECLIPHPKQLSDFKVGHHSHFRRLIRPKSSILYVEGGDPNFETMLLAKLTDTGLEKIARDHLFKLEITGQHQEGGFHISTSYPLAFPAREEVVRPLIALHKWLIDQAIGGG
jgi:hypothetical protein